MKPRLAATVTMALALSLLTLVATTAPSEAGPPASSEFRVNTTTAGGQDDPAVASNAVGESVVVWVGAGPDGGTAIYAQRYYADGSPRGAELRVNTTIGDRSFPDVAMDPAGDYVVTWTSAGQDGSGDGVYARRFPIGRGASGEVRVNPSTAGDQHFSTVAMDAAGNYVVSWTSNLNDGNGDAIYARRYTAAGVGSGATVVSTATPSSGTHKDSDVSMSAAGSFVVAWESYTQYTAAIFAQRYNAAGAPQGLKTLVNSGDDLVRLGAVAMDAVGRYAIAWIDQPDYTLVDVYVRRFNASGIAQDSGTPLGGATAGNQVDARLAMDASGDYLVTWSTEAAGDGDDVYGRRFTSTGTPQGAEFRVNQVATDNQYRPAVALDADGDAVVAWETAAQYSSDSDVFARRFRTLNAVDLGVDQVDDVDPAPVLGQVTFRARVTNVEDPSTETGVTAIDAGIGAATGVSVVSTIPRGATYVSGSGDGWTCTPATAKVTCRLVGALPAGEVSSRLAVTYMMPAGADTVFHTARVDENQLDPVASNNSTTVATDVECVVQLAQAGLSVAEGDTAMVQVQRTGTGCGPSSIAIDTVAGTAVPGTDYDDTGGVVLFGTGDTTKVVQVPITDDTLDEKDETFRVRLSEPDGALLGQQRVGVTTIADDDDPPRINFTTTDGSGGEPGALIDATLRLSEVSGRLVTVTLDPSGTATVGDDYFAPTRVSIPAGQREVTFTIEVADDDVVESDERAFLTLAKPVAVTPGSLATFQVYITSDE
ncbi:Calx-beta domain-containing protein [Nocardioides sp. MH1]|uniref:Calx-beta domain-containing protein n=1 Tax=Nocardioides sp. MH1 TaxID=3242490 RepID=UPI00352263B1